MEQSTHHSLLLSFYSGLFGVFISPFCLQHRFCFASTQCLSCIAAFIFLFKISFNLISLSSISGCFPFSFLYVFLSPEGCIFSLSFLTIQHTWKKKQKNNSNSSFLFSSSNTAAALGEYRALVSKHTVQRHTASACVCAGYMQKPHGR